MSTYPPTSVIDVVGRQHLAGYEMLYREMDPQERGVIGAQDAAQYMKRSNVGIADLGKIWELADYKQLGRLDKIGAFIALKLIAAVQHGLDISTTSLTLDIAPPSIASRADTPSLPSFAGTTGNVHPEWAVEDVDRLKYEAIFDSLTPIDGKLSGDKVRPVLLNSGLPANVLGKIWELSDIDKDGMLDREEMCVALHLVYRALQNDTIPNALPFSLVPPGKRSMVGAGAGGGRRTSMPATAVPVLPRPINQRTRTGSVASIDSVGVFGSPMLSSNATARPQTFQTTRSLTTTPTVSATILQPSWPIDKLKYEACFNEADTDHDGFVSGGDVKSILLTSGLPQQHLAHIWTLADIAKNGRLNLEQFSLTMYLIDQKRELGIDPPVVLPLHLIPPSFRTTPGGMNDISTLTNHDELSSSIVSSGNKEIDVLTAEIERLRAQRRITDSAVVQLEADMTVKQSEIKNLQIELNTLEGTVKQLDRQKGEAGRRLNELDVQIVTLTNTLKDMQDKVALEQAHITQLRTESMISLENARSQEDAINAKKAELQALRDEERRLEHQLQLDMAQLATTGQNCSRIDAEISATERANESALNETRTLQTTLERLEQLLVINDVESIGREQSSLLSSMSSLSLNSNSSSSPKKTSSTPSYYDQVPTDNTAISDPFASRMLSIDQYFDLYLDDPFGGGTSTGVDPFASSGGGFDDPFGTKDPFASSDAWSAKPTTARGAPPRPAPPKNRPNTPKDVTNNIGGSANDPFSGSDPFSSSTATTTDGNFANFANFSTFS